MNKDKRNNIQLLGTLNNADESGIIANASQIYDAVANKSVEERITDLDKKIESEISSDEGLKYEIIKDKIIQFKDKDSNNLYPLILGDSIPNNGIEVSKLSKSVHDKINEDITNAVNVEKTRAEGAESTLDGRVDTLEEAVGTGGSVDSRIASAVATETSRAQEAETNRYTKNETYTKEEVNNLITTPNQKYVSVTATSQTTSVTDVLPATGAADTTYRVGNWDGTQYNDSVFSEYAWNGSVYIKLSTKSQIGEVYDISANHADTKYADLAAALGTNGANVPQSLRKGGMSVKFIQSSDNKYMQYRLMSNTFSTTESDWQGVDDEPTAGSNNLVKSGGVKNSANNSILATTNMLSNKTLSKNTVGNDAEAYLGYFDVVAGHTYEIYAKSESLLKDGRVILGLGYNGNINVSGDSILNGYTWIKTATVSTNKGRIYLDMRNGNEGVPVFVSIKDISTGYSLDEMAFKFNEIDTKWYVDNLGDGPIFNSSHSVTFSPIVKCRKFDGSTNSHSADIFDIVKTAIDGYQNSNIQLSYNTTNRTATINFVTLDNTHCTIYYNIVTNSYRFTINNYDMKSNEIMVLDICSIYDGMTFAGKAGVQWTAFYTQYKIFKNIQCTIKKTKDSALRIYRKEVNSNLDKEDLLGNRIRIIFDGTQNAKVRITSNRSYEWMLASTTTFTDALDSGNRNSSYIEYYSYSKAAMGFVESVQNNYITISLRKDDSSVITDIEREQMINSINIEVYCALSEKNISTYDDLLKGTVYDTILQQLNFYTTGWSGSKGIPLNLIHFSDIHGDGVNLARIVAFKNKYNTLISDLIHTGDMVNYQWNDGMEFWDAVTGSKDILMAIGNHDPNDPSTGVWWYSHSASECYNKYFKDRITNWNVVQPLDGNNNILEVCYYYKDYARQKIRLIVLDGMSWNNLKADNQQKQWLQNVLDDARNVTNQYNVIIASHFPAGVSNEHNNPTVTFDAFYANERGWEQDAAGYGLLHPDVLSMVDDFQDNGGNFICYLGGHTHTDLFRTPTSYPNQLMINVANASNNKNVHQHAESYVFRNIGDRTQDLFNVVSVDTVGKFISVARIGNDFDRIGRHQGVIVYDYANHKVISQF